MPKPKLLPAIAMIPFALVLSACETTGRTEIVKPPAHLTTCADEPAVPMLPGREEQAERDALTLAYILGLRSAWGDCRSKVDGIRAWSDGL